MDASLWLLIGLRARAWIRAWEKNLKTLKGGLLALVGVFVFVPLLASALLAPRVQTEAQLDAVRHYGALGLLIYCVLNVLFSSGDRAVSFSPAEVNFLLCGPYRPRQLLLYKLAMGTGLGAVTAFFLTCVLTPHSARFLSSYIGLFLTIQLIYLFSMTIGSAVSTFGARAYSRGQKGLLAVVVLLIVAVVGPLGRKASALPISDLIDHALRSPTLSAATLPFRPFVMAYASEKFWPDLVGWSALALVVDLTLLGLVVALNARFIAASASASVRNYDTLRRTRGKAGWTGDLKWRLSLPMMPWWEGVGPNLWRHLTSASRFPIKLGGIALNFMVPSVVLVVVLGAGTPSLTFGSLLLVYATMTLISSATVGGDFRADFARMEELKTLPIAPTQLVLGQLIAPVLILSGAQWLTLIALAFLVAGPFTLAAAALLAVPINFIFIAVENLSFLWYPSRTVATNSFDFQTLGRQYLLILGKLAAFVVAVGLAASVAYVVNWVSGGNRPVVLIAVGTVLVAVGLGFVPLIALAFDRFDVAADRTE